MRTTIRVGLTQTGAQLSLASSGRIAIGRLGESPIIEPGKAIDIRPAVQEPAPSGGSIAKVDLAPAPDGILLLSVAGKPAERIPGRIVFHPLDHRPIRVGRTAYEGAIEVFQNRGGKLTIVNQLPIERYLLGVVPNELGPIQFPAAEAQKAQTVAARTYALASLGRHAAAGFDLCAGPHCQVYGSMGTHQQASGKAVAETAGLILTFQGKPIKALFTSTCGGRTANVETVFSGEAVPYLRSVPCQGEAIEKRASARAPSFGEEGTIVSEDLVFARLARLPIPPDPMPGYLATRAAPTEVRAWLALALSALGRQGGATAPPEAMTRDALASYLVDAFALRPRDHRDMTVGSSRLLDLAPDRGLVIDQEAFRIMLATGAFLPFQDHTLRPWQHPSRASTIRAFARILRQLGVPRLSEGTYRRSTGTGLLIDLSGSLARFRLAPGASLFRDVRGWAFPVRSLSLRNGDRVVLHRSQHGIDYLKGIDLGKGTKYDRFSKYSSWQAVLTAGEIERLLGIQGLKNLKVEARGPSGRVSRLLLEANSGDQMLTGLDIRFSLGLRENWFTIERQGPHLYRFLGHGFGHGVGLCQVGAYGMAIAGQDFRAILTHYYSGATITKLTPSSTTGT